MVLAADTRTFVQNSDHTRVLLRADGTSKSNRPNAQKMRSVSISDIIVIHNRSETQAFYVDEYGYRQVDYLLPELENMKQAEPEPYER